MVKYLAALQHSHGGYEGIYESLMGMAGFFPGYEVVVIVTEWYRTTVPCTATIL
jgi:hypothetical protein